MPGLSTELAGWRYIAILSDCNSQAGLVLGTLEPWGLDYETLLLRPERVGGRDQEPVRQQIQLAVAQAGGGPQQVLYRQPVGLERDAEGHGKSHLDLLGLVG